MLIEEIDVIGTEPPQGTLDRFADPRGAASFFHAHLASIPERIAKLGADHHLVAQALERPAEQIFVRVWAVALGRVEKRASQLNAAMQRGDRLSLIRRAV